MRNLIYVNMMRLKKSRIFRAGVAVSMAYVAFLLFMNYQEMTDSPETVIGQPYTATLTCWSMKKTQKR